MTPVLRLSARPSAALAVLNAAVLLAALLVWSGCSASGRVSSDSPEEAYEKGLADFERGRCTRAIDHFRSVFDFGRTHEWADDAQLYLARSYYCNREYLLAGNEYTRFIEFYRNDERVEEAEYGRIESYYQLSPPYQLDQTETKRAIAFIRAYLRRYPQSENTQTAVTRLEELSEKLARKQYEAGELYMRRELYEAAALAYLAVLDEYPSSPYADDALLGALRAQTTYAQNSITGRQADRFQEAIDTYDRFVQIFPESPLVRRAEAIYVEAQDGHDAAMARAGG
ncbi:MAG: outer membrane protein assembly factor BamD [Bacteroidota bacterium]